jgi:23S rRNA-/tRNA-specific pseudouridylate synthase
VEDLRFNQNQLITKKIIPEIEMTRKKHNKQECKRMRNGLKVHHHCRNDTYTQLDYKLPLLHSDDEELIVVDKPCDIVLTATAKQEWNLIYLLQRDHGELVKNKIDDSCVNNDSDDVVSVVPVYKSFKMCHQIDYETSGLCVIALTKQAASSISRAFLNRQVEKYYLMIVCGKVNLNQLKLQKQLEQNWNEEDSLSDDENQRLTVTTFVRHSNSVFKGKMKHVPPNDPLALDNTKTAEAISKFKVLSYGTYHNYDVTLLAARIITGRRHQLRLQCEYMGHPIVGDILHYGNEYNKQNAYDADRVMLHSYHMKIIAQGDCSHFKQYDILQFMTVDNPLEKYMNNVENLITSRDPCTWNL